MQWQESSSLDRVTTLTEQYSGPSVEVPLCLLLSAHLCKRNERLVWCECWLLEALAPVDGEAGTGYLYPGVDTLHQRQLPRGHLRQQHLHEAFNQSERDQAPVFMLRHCIAKMDCLQERLGTRVLQSESGIFKD